MTESLKSLQIPLIDDIITLKGVSIISNLEENELLEKFIKENLTLLTSNQKDQISKIKTKKNQFFRNQPGIKIPKNPKIAYKLIFFLIKIKKIKNQSDLNNLLEISPYIEKYLQVKDFDSLIEDLEDQNIEDEIETFLSKEDLTEIKKENYLKQVILKKTEKYKEKLQKHLEQKSQEEIDKERKKIDIELQKLRAREKEFEEIYSVMEDIPMIEITEEFISQNIPEPIVYDSDLIWWKRIGLIKNPFPSIHGLMEIEEKYYEEIVIKTPIFLNFIKLLNQSKEELFNKSYILCGEYGCGKTTFFDYFKRLLITKYIYPIHIVLSSEQNFSWILSQFNRLVYFELASKLTEERYINLQGIKEQNISTLEIIALMNELKNNTRYKSFDIFIDGLHKSEKYRSQSYEFLAYLQNFQESIGRAGIEVGFFVAGSNLWFKELKGQSRISSTFYEFEQFKNITKEQAHQMLSQRFKAFSINQKQPVKIRSEDVEKIHDIITAKYMRDITFRDIIDEIVPKLRKSNFSFIDFSTLLDPQTLQDIGVLFFSNEEVSKQFSKLEEICKHNTEDFFYILKMIKDISEMEYLLESDQLFIQNKNLLFALHNIKLIKKLKIEGNKIVWVLSSPLKSLIKKIHDKFNLNFSDYIIQIFSKKTSEKDVLHKIPKEILTIINQILKWDYKIISDYEDKLRNSTEIYRLTYNYLYFKNVNLKEFGQNLITTLMDGLDPLLRIMLYIAGEFRDVSRLPKPLLFFIFSRTWVSTDDFSHFYDQITLIRRDVSMINEQRISEISRDYLRAYDSLINELVEIEQNNPIILVGSRILNIEVKKSLDELRKRFRNQEYNECCNGLWNIIEMMLRERLYLLFIILFGKKWTRRIPNDIKNTIYQRRNNRKNIDYYKLYYKDENLLVYCDRISYSKIIFNKENWNNIFKFIFRNLDISCNNEKLVQANVELFFDNLNMIANLAKHEYPDEYWEGKIEILLESIQKSKKYLEVLNSIFYNILSNFNNFIELDDNTYYIKVTGATDYKKFAPMDISLDDLKHKAYEIQSKLFKIILDSPKKILKLKIFDSNEIYQIFQCQYRIFFFVLFQLIKKSIVIVNEDIHGKIKLKINNKKLDEVLEFINK